jgi:hypothetical protein
MYEDDDDDYLDKNNKRGVLKDIYPQPMWNVDYSQ